MMSGGIFCQAVILPVSGADLGEQRGRLERGSSSARQNIERLQLATWPVPAIAIGSKVKLRIPTNVPPAITGDGDIAGNTGKRRGESGLRLPRIADRVRGRRRAISRSPWLNPTRIPLDSFRGSLSADGSDV